MLEGQRWLYYYIRNRFSVLCKFGNARQQSRLPQQTRSAIIFRKRERIFFICCLRIISYFGDPLLSSTVRPRSSFLVLCCADYAFQSRRRNRFFFLLMACSRSSKQTGHVPYFSEHARASASETRVLP